MTTYTTDRVERYIADNDLKIIMVFHDDFNRHETYVLAKRKDGAFLTILYVASDDHLEVEKAHDGPAGLAYLMSTAFCTYALEVTSDECDTTAMLQTARAMKICDEAGIGITYKAIWNDRDTIISQLKSLESTLRDSKQLRQWLEQK